MTHWKKLTNPNYLGVYALDENKDIILTIKVVQEEKVVGTDGKKDDCVVCHFVENVPPMILNKTNMKTIEELFGTPYVEEWVGKQIQIGSELVRAFGATTEALRVRKVKVEEVQPVFCANCGKEITGVGSMNAQQTAEYTKKKYGKQLCSVCATAIANGGKTNG